MRSAATVVILVIAVASSGWAGVIYDVRTGVYEVGEEVPDIVDVVVVHVTLYYVRLSENPSGEYRAIPIRDSDWGEYPGSLSVGDVVTISGAEVDSETLLIIDLSGGDSIVVTGSTEVPWLDVTHEAIDNHPDGDTPWHYSPLHFSEGFTIIDTWGGDSFRAASILCGHEFLFGPMGDPIQHDVGDCFQGARGFYFNMHDGMGFVQNGIEIIDCSLPVQALSFGTVKALYR